MERFPFQQCRRMIAAIECGVVGDGAEDADLQRLRAALHEARARAAAVVLALV